MHFRFLRNLGLSIVLAMLPGLESRGLQPATPLARLARQSWSMENGLPQNTVPVLLQSRSGYLWAGTELGLARFDGVGFRIFDHATAPAFPDAEIRCLLDARGSGTDGDLWVGTADGLVRWVSDRPVLLTARDGLPSNSIRGLAQAADGTVWAWTEAGLARWDGARFQAVTLDSGLSGDRINSIATSTAGDLWVGTSAGAIVLHGGRWKTGPQGQHGANGDIKTWRKRTDSLGTASLVERADNGDVLIATSEGIFRERGGTVNQVSATATLPEDGVSFLAETPDGTIAVVSKSTAALLPNPGVAGGSPSKGMARFTVANQLPGAKIESVYADREGSLWVGTNHGLARITIDNGKASVDLLPPNDPLAANAVVSFLEDREGDLWIGTETAGLHILRDARFRIVGASDGLSSDATTAIVEDARGSVWIGTRDAGLNRISNGRTSSLTTSNGLLSNVILALAAAPSGDVWVGTPDGLNRIGNSGVTSYTSADGLPDDFIRSVLVAPDESVWIGTRHGLTHLDHGRFLSFSQADGLGSDLVGALVRAPDGDLWIATLNGLSRLHQGHLHNYTTADGLSSNVITALDGTPDGMLWIGTQSDGLNLWDGKQFRPVRADSGTLAPLPAAIHAILQDDRGHLWLASNSGLTRANTQSLLDCALRGQCSIQAIQANHFTTADGLRSRETSSNSHPTACRRGSGELWFTTPRGVIVVDPQHFAAIPAAPPVVIERFSVDDKDVNSGPNARITAGHLSFQFDYAGLSFAAPQKLRYQYKLEGFDHAWTEAGTRRTAYYTNIPPGSYSFRVRATFADSGPQATAGTASYNLTSAPSESPEASEAAMSFVLLPHFYQTAWFRALAILLVVALILWFFRRRVIRVQREFRAVMQERNRIAREIHDTLAQGYVGISLQLEILGELLRHNRTEAAAKHLALTQGLVREGLDDARQSIWALRSHDAAEKTLPIRLRRLVEQVQDATLTATLDVHGAYRPLAPEVETEILRIAQEAIQNVKRHAAASRLSARLDYGERTLALSVSDDGRGFQVPAATSGNPTASKAGHYGLTGMRERAALIHAEIELGSEPGAGTSVLLRVPAPEAQRTLTLEDESKDISSNRRE
jgi:signal transduction histidine kinase/ligand-binding sensor domain-containing protein